MNAKDIIAKALKALIQQSTMKNQNARFTYMNILKELNRTQEPIEDIRDMRNLRFVKEKTYKRIQEGVSRICDGDPSMGGLLKQKLLGSGGHKEGRLENMGGCIGYEGGCTDKSINTSTEIIENPMQSYYSDSSLVIIAASEEDRNSKLKMKRIDNEESKSSSIVILEDSHTNNTKQTDTQKNREGAEPANCHYVGESSTHNSNTHSIKHTQNKKYIPGYRTAAYAILRALSELNGAHKYLVALRAAPHTDAEFDKTQRFSAFSAFKILEKKGLIYRETSTRYFLTDEGKSLCAGLFSTAEPAAADNTIHLVIDSREKRSHRDRSFFQSFFTTRGVSNCTRFLGLGDFLWIRNETVLNYIIERKGGTDFAASIYDGRYREQKHRLKAFGINAFYIIENMKTNEANTGRCSHCLTEAKLDGLVVLETDDINESAEMIMAIDRQIRAGAFDEGVSYGSFIEEGGRHSGLSPHTVLLAALLGIRGLGPQRALGLAEHFGTLSGILEAAEEGGFEERLAKRIVEGREIGKKMARRIAKMIL